MNPLGRRVHDLTDQPGVGIPVPVSQDGQIGMNGIQSGQGIHFNERRNSLPVIPDIDTSAVTASQDLPCFQGQEGAGIGDGFLRNGIIHESLIV